MARSKKEETQVETVVAGVDVTPNVDEPPHKKSKRRKKEKEKKKKKKTKTSQEEHATDEEVESGVEGTPVPKDTTDVKTTPISEEVAEEVAVESTESTESSPEDVKDDQDDQDDQENQFSENREKTDELLKGLITTVQDRIASDKTLLSCLRELNRQVTRERKEVGKIVKKLHKGQRKKRRGGNKSPGGFTKPAPLSGPMCVFLEVSDGTELPRTEVTRRVNRYVKENDLQNPENKKQILADGKLKSLLYLKDDDELTYFNLQRYMKIHFLKKDPETGNILPYVPPEPLVES